MSSIESDHWQFDTCVDKPCSSGTLLNYDDMALSKTVKPWHTEFQPLFYGLLKIEVDEFQMQQNVHNTNR
jgi:hypothetical protein